ncbi:MAG: 3-oxoacyl-ACP synthase, partial [Acidimicrobiales bacterium]
MSVTRGIAVRSCGIQVPDKVLTNDDLAARLDTNDAWITERTGIRERHVGGSTSSLAADAGRRALERAGLSATDIDVLVLATT